MVHSLTLVVQLCLRTVDKPCSGRFISLSALGLVHLGTVEMLPSDQVRRQIPSHVVWAVSQQLLSDKISCGVSDATIPQTEDFDLK